MCVWLEHLNWSSIRYLYNKKLQGRNFRASEASKNLTLKIVWLNVMVTRKKMPEDTSFLRSFRKLEV